MKRLFQRFAESIGVETCLPLLIVALAMTLFLFGLRLPLLRVSPIDPDELSHLHCAWSVSKGMLIYRDFFENHTPWFYFLVAPLFSFFSVETNISDAFSFFFGARYLMWLAAGASLVLTFRIGILWRNAPVAWVGTIFLSLTTVFLGKTIEIRPDVPALAFFLACLITVIGAMRSEGSGLGVRSRFALSGAFLGAALMFLPKILLVGPGFALAMLWYVCDPRGRRNFGDRLRDVIWQSIGFAVPLGLTMGYFASRGALQEFIWFNLLLNLTYGATTSMSPLPLLKFLLRESPFLVVLGLIGFARGFFEMFGSVNFRRGDYVLVLSALSLFAGLFLTPLPYHQYYVMFLPLLALFAATSLVQLAEFFVAALGRRGERGNFSARLGTTLTLLTGAGLWLLIRWVGPPVLIEASYIWLWVSAVVVSLPFFLARKRDWVLVIYLVALSVGPLNRMFRALSPLNTKYKETLQQIAFVMENTKPTDPVMDGFTGWGVFRPHAHFYWLLQEEFPMVTRQQRVGLLADLRSGRAAPKLVFLDRNLRLFSSDVTEFVEKNYEPFDHDIIWRRKDIWLDDRSSPLFGKLDLGRAPGSDLVGPGWSQPESEGETSFRRSRGRRSWLRVPIRVPGDFRAIVRTRLEWFTRPVTFELSVNGTPVGRARLAEGWRDYHFRVPARLLRSGVNSFLFTYSRVPWQDDPQYQGRNTVMAVEYLKMERQDQP